MFVSSLVWRLSPASTSKSFGWALRKLVIRCQHEMLDIWKTNKQEVQTLNSGPEAIWAELIAASVYKCFTCSWWMTHDPEHKQRKDNTLETAVRKRFCNSEKNALTCIVCIVEFFSCQKCVLVLWRQLAMKPDWLCADVLNCHFQNVVADVGAEAGSWKCLSVQTLPAHPTLKPLPTIYFLTIRLLPSLRLQASGFGKCACTCVSHVLSHSTYSH